VAAAPTSATLTAFVNELVRAGRQRPDSHWLLVLDDYHAIEAPEVHEAMTFLLDHMPDHLHLLLATRPDPPLPLSRLRSRGQLTEERAADLRVAPAEARGFLNEVMGPAPHRGRRAGARGDGSTVPVALPQTTTRS
jgi:LuxR family maltose regulon positive regulatory protein